MQFRRPFLFIVLSVLLSAGAMPVYAVTLPVVSSQFANSYPTAGGVALTISGSNFGTDPEVASVSVGGSNCPITSINISTIVCTLPAGSGIANTISVTVDGENSNTNITLNYDAPSVSGASATSYPTSGGVTLSITGSNFGNSIGAASVTVGGNACAITTINHTAISCALPAGSGTNKSVSVTVGGQLSSGSVFVSYDAPSVSGASAPSYPTAGGVTLSITGSNFGNSIGAASVTVGGNACAITTINHTAISCALPAGSGTNKSVSVTVSGQVSNSTTLSYDAPVVGGITPDQGSEMGGYDVAIIGSNFGANGASVAVGGNPCLVNTQTHTSITCTMPMGVVGPAAVVVTQSGQASSGSVFFNYHVIVFPLNGVFKGSVIRDVQATQ